MADRVQFITQRAGNGSRTGWSTCTVVKREVARRLKESIEDSDLTVNAGYAGQAR